MDWFVEAEYVAPITQEQYEQAAEGSFMAHYQEKAQLLRLTGRLDGTLSYEAAVTEALRWATDVGVVRMGLAKGPDRLVVESAAARAREWSLLGAAEVATRLGVSTARVRQLEQRPDFPRPVKPDLAGGKIWRAEDIDEFARTWSRQPGRPRKATPNA